MFMDLVEGILSLTGKGGTLDDRPMQPCDLPRVTAESEEALSQRGLFGQVLFGPEGKQ